MNKVDVQNKTEIADAFNDFYTNIDHKLASQVPESSKTVETYINKVNVITDQAFIDQRIKRCIFLAKKK